MSKMIISEEELIIRSCVDCVLGHTKIGIKPINVNLDSEKAKLIVKSQLRLYGIIGPLSVFNEEEAVNEVITAIKEL